MKRNVNYQPPFPYFGGSSCASPNAAHILAVRFSLLVWIARRLCRQSVARLAFRFNAIRRSRITVEIADWLCRLARSALLLSDRSAVANPLMRIVLKGYEGEHDMPTDWREAEWQAAGGYGLQGDEDGDGRKNRKRERLWFSPHCRKANQGSLFGDFAEETA